MWRHGTKMGWWGVGCLHHPQRERSFSIPGLSLGRLAVQLSNAPLSGTRDRGETAGPSGRQSLD